MTLSLPIQVLLAYLSIVHLPLPLPNGLSDNTLISTTKVRNIQTLRLLTCIRAMTHKLEIAVSSSVAASVNASQLLEA